MASSDPASLDNLNDFVFPEPAGWLPLASVWKFAIAMAIIWMAAWVWIRVISYLHNAYRREAIRELNAIETAGDVVRLNELLKRTAMKAYGRDEVASLHGERWLAFLGGSNDYPSIERIAVLGDASSQTEPISLSDQTCAEVFSFARNWIRTHERAAKPC